MSECEFRKCGSECCRYISVYLKTPRSKADFDEIRWFVTHENVRVYKDHDKNWLVEFVTPCKFLNKDLLCDIYKKRPEVCSGYEADNCTYHTPGPIFDKIMFAEPADVDRFLAERKKQREKKKSGK